MTALFPMGRQFARAQSGNITSASAPLTAGSPDAAQEPMSGPSTAQLARTRLKNRGPAHLRSPRWTGLAPLQADDRAANLAAHLRASKKSSSGLSSSVRGLPELTARARTYCQALPVHLRGYGVAAGIALALLLLNSVSSSPLTVLYSASPRPANSTVGKVSSYFPPEGQETDGDRFTEALFVSRSLPPYNYSAGRRIDIAASQPRTDSSGYLAGAPLRADNGKPTEAVNGSSSQLSRDQEPRAEAAAGVHRSEGAAKTVKVIAASLVRKRPHARAEIISTLEPSSRVAVLARTGDFYQIRSLDKPPIRGYVHREDAFFERNK
jgi:hypothetical protein